MSELRSGTVAAEVAAEFPGLRLRLADVAAPSGPSPVWLRRRLAELSNRVRGAGVVAMRARPVERAFRTFYRQIGLDPDVHRIPSEAAAVGRLLHGGFASTGRLADARLVALLETGVPVWALDHQALGGVGLDIRSQSGGLVIAAGDRIAAVLFDEPAADLAVGGSTERVLLYAVGVDGVPEIHVEEALWICLELLATP